MLPMLTDVIELLDFLISRNTVLTDEDLDDARGRVGRTEGPTLISELHSRALLTDDQLTRTLGEVWSMAEYPDSQLGHARWLTLFGTAGYTVDGRPAARPDTAVRLYRGSVAARRGDWSWTDSLDVATAYAHDSIGGRPRGTIWTALVDPERLLARNTGRDENEYVVNTARLTITALSAHGRN